MQPNGPRPLLTVGHGTLSAAELVALLRGAQVASVVDVRRHPGSRRNPHLSGTALGRSLPEAGIAYRWEVDLGGRRTPRPDSPNAGLRNAAFRGYADYMSTSAFRGALERLLAEASEKQTAIMCAETLWWRCHRRLVADAAVLLAGKEVLHLGHEGALFPHVVTNPARVEDAELVYPAEAVSGSLF